MEVLGRTGWEMISGGGGFPANLILVLIPVVIVIAILVMLFTHEVSAKMIIGVTTLVMVVVVTNAILAGTQQTLIDTSVPSALTVGYSGDGISWIGIE